MDKKTLLVIMDGWGYAPPWGGNAIAMASTPYYDGIIRNYSNNLISASGHDVGLPGHEMGNSEVGHLNIGAGQIVRQDILNINNAIEDRSFFNNAVIIEAIDRAINNNKNVHLMGLCSNGGVHSHINHAYAFLYLAKLRGAKNVYVHCFTDGRDSPPTSAQSFIVKLQNAIKKIGIGQIATVSGRYYAMDRDHHWERIARAYDAMVEGKGNTATTPLGAISNAYQNGESDEFITPTIILKDNQPPPIINDGDSIIFGNFRSDRARQLTQAFLKQNIDDYNQKRVIRQDIFFVSMIPYGYEQDIGVKPNSAFSPKVVSKTLASVLSEKEIPQLHIAETEKYAHVTYYFNGTIEQPYSREDRVLVPSPRVATYDQKPEMSASEITDRLIKEINRDYYGFIVVNFANPDMVGHTGVFDSIRTACETVSQQLERFVEIAQKKGYLTIITADHGNAEQSINPLTYEPDTEHTSNPVPFIVVPPEGLNTPITLRDYARLSDVAPTILSYMKIEQPNDMSGTSIITNQWQ